MKQSQPSLGTPGASKTPAHADLDVARPWHPTVLGFTLGVEVTEVVDSLPGELLELFKTA
jgi:hypothetical protein